MFGGWHNKQQQLLVHLSETNCYAGITEGKVIKDGMELGMRNGNEQLQSSNNDDGQGTNSEDVRRDVGAEAGENRAVAYPCASCGVFSYTFSFSVWHAVCSFGLALYLLF